MIRRSESRSSFYFILGGGGLCLSAGFLLLIVYGMCLTNPSSPTYYLDKLPVMFDLGNGGGVIAWPASVTFLFEIALIGYGIVLPLLRSPLDFEEPEASPSFRPLSDKPMPTKLATSGDQSGITVRDERFRP
jgi:hypothetical protein